VPFEGIGNIEAWLHDRRAAISCTRLFEEVPSLPTPGDFDLLIAMGGPMSVNDEVQLPWLRDEKRLIAQAVASGKAVLGICLGAQLIASAFGARVFPNAQKEIGWFPVFAEETADGLFRFPPEFLAFHWHGETFELPAGAVRLAGSAACKNQAFQLGPRALGLQFHLETTPESADAIITHTRDHLAAGPYIQSEANLRATPRQTYAAANALMSGVLDYLTRKPAR